MKLIYSTFLLILGSFLLMNHSGGRADSQGQGNSGAPGDNNKVCKNCHNSSTIVTTMDINLINENDETVEKYIPGETYTVQVKLNPTKGSPAAYGFQMVCLNAELNKNGKDLKNWIDNEMNNYKIAVADNDRTYVEHDRPSSSKEFNVQWKAPEKGTGTVSFYSAGNAVNLNGSTTGDGATKNSVSIQEDNSTEVSLNILDQLNIFPNSFNEVLYIELPYPVIVKAKIFNSNGSLVAESTIQNQLAWNLSHLSKGVYHLRINSSSTNETIVRKLMKM